MRWSVPLVLVAALAACADAPQYEPLPAGSTVLAFGDSVTHGTGASRGEDYPYRLAALSRWEVVNAGIPGDTAAEGRHRFAALLQEHEPRLVLIGLGGNDFLRRRPAAEVKEDLREMVRSARAQGAVPVLIGVPELSVFAAATGRLSDSPIYAELAEEEDILHIPSVFTDVLSDERLRADRVHPNAEGYRVFTEGIADALADAGLLAH
jgi:acyl-CoA thioesterase I